MEQFSNLAEAEEAARRLYDVRLFTVLGISGDEVVRLHSSDLEAYPLGGRKSLSVDIAPEWVETCVQRGEVFLGLTPGDVECIFADHALIESLGCGAIANAPVIDGGAVIGALSILTPEGGLTSAAATEVRRIAAGCVDAVRDELAKGDAR
ncbi:hypothetical protein [Mariniluteicoccus flavus]